MNRFRCRLLPFAFSRERRCRSWPEMVGSLIDPMGGKENRSTKKSALRAAAPLVALAALSLAACADYGRNPISSTRFLMGTTCTITLYERPPEGIFDRLFDRLEQIDQRMSVQREESEVNAVNRAAGRDPVRVSPDTFTVIARGLEFSRLSGGAFDITVGPLVRLWGIGTEQARVPSPQEIRQALRLVGYGGLVLNEAERTVYLERAGMSLDLGAIAKGYAADECVRLLRQAGVKHAIVALGGNIYALDHKPGGSPWRIGIQGPQANRGVAMGILTVADRSVVTSGPYERYFEQDGVLYHHILDTRTGYPARSGLSSTTIVSADSTAADALSTATFVLGVERGLALVRGLKGVEAVFLTEGHRAYSTPGIRASFQITNPSFRAAGAEDSGDEDIAGETEDGFAEGAGGQSAADK